MNTGRIYQAAELKFVFVARVRVRSAFSITFYGHDHQIPRAR
jgi:hypothetical protein